MIITNVQLLAIIKYTQVKDGPIILEFHTIFNFVHFSFRVSHLKFGKPLFILEAPKQYNIAYIIDFEKNKMLLFLAE